MSTASGPTPPDPSEGRPPEASQPESSSSEPTAPESSTPDATTPQRPPADPAVPPEPSSGATTPWPDERGQGETGRGAAVDQDPASSGGPGSASSPNQNMPSEAWESDGPSGAWRPEEYTPGAAQSYPEVWGQGRPEGSQANTPSWNTGAPAREGASLGLVIGLAAVGGVVLLLVVALLAFLVVRTVDFSGGDDPAPVATEERVTEQPAESAEPAEGTSAPAPVAVEGAQVLGAPSGKPLFRKTGTLEKTAVNDEDENSIPVPAHDGPVLVVWSSTGSGAGRLYVNGHEKKGGELSASLPAVRSGNSGTALLNTGGYKRNTGVLYAQGTQGTEWEIQGYALSAVPKVERGKPVTGTGPRVFRVPAGAATDYRLSVAGGEDTDFPVLKVYAADDLTTTESNEYKGKAPVDLDVSVDGGEKIVVVETEQQWSFTAR